MSLKHMINQSRINKKTFFGINTVLYVQFILTQVNTSTSFSWLKYLSVDGRKFTYIFLSLPYNMLTSMPNSSHWFLPLRKTRKYTNNTLLKGSLASIDTGCTKVEAYFSSAIFLWLIDDNKRSKWYFFYIIRSTAICIVFDMYLLLLFFQNNYPQEPPQDTNQKRVNQ